MYGNFFAFDLKPHRFRRYGRQYDVQSHYSMGARHDRVVLVKDRSFSKRKPIDFYKKQKRKKKIASASRQYNRRHK